MRSGSPPILARAFPRRQRPLSTKQSNNAPATRWRANSTSSARVGPGGRSAPSRRRPATIDNQNNTNSADARRQPTTTDRSAQDVRNGPNQTSPRCECCGSAAATRMRRMRSQSNSGGALAATMRGVLHAPARVPGTAGRVSQFPVYARNAPQMAGCPQCEARNRSRTCGGNPNGSRPSLPG